MKTQTKIITYLIAILMLLQPLMVTVAYATGSDESVVADSTNGKQTIIISDAKLYEALKSKIGNNAAYIDGNTIEIDKVYLNSITELKLEDSEISDLGGIENFTELTYLDLSGNKLTANSGLDKINSLTKLAYLDLSRNQIEDVSAISSLLNKSGLDLDLDQDIKVVGFVSKIPQPEEYSDAENILLNDIRETIDLPQIVYGAYENMNIFITEIKADGIKIDKSEFSDYAEIKDGKIRILNRDNNQYEIKIKVEGDKPNNGTTCEIKAFRIDTENQEGIVFKDENLYESIKEKYQYAIGEKTKNFIHSEYSEWDYTFTVEEDGESFEWTFDDENLIIVAMKKDLEMIQTLTVSTKAISNLTGIEKFVGLKDISFENNRIIDVSPIVELNENKKKVTEEFKEKYKAYVAKLPTLASTYDSLKTQIETIDKEIEDLEKAIANGEAITGTETTAEKEVRKAKLEVEQAKTLSNIIKIVEKIDEICDPDGTKGISTLLTGPSIESEIVEILETIELSGKDVLTQKDIIENNKLVDLSTRIVALLDNLTEAEITELVDVTLTYYYYNDAGKLTEEAVVLITEEKKETAEAKYAIEHIKTYIDKTLDEDILDEDFIKKINDLTGSEIIMKDGSGDTKTPATLREEFKAAVNRYFASKNGITAAKVIKFCEDNGIVSEEKLLIEAKDDIIPIIKQNITEYGAKASEEAIEALKQNIIKNVFDLDEMKEENEEIINEILIPAYNNLNTKLQKEIDEDGNYIYPLGVLREALKDDEKYLNNPDDLLRIVQRLQNVPDADIEEVVKVADLVNVNLMRNIVNNADKLSEIETLEILDLSHNYISNFSFDKFQMLEQLFINSNSIKDPEITGMENIKVLNLSKNWIDDASKMNLSGMPKLYSWDLSGNRINDIESLINSKNEYLESLEYKNVGEYWQDGNSGIQIGGQVLAAINEYRSDLTDIELQLPKIFSQMKELETPSFRVTFDCTTPLYNVSQDGKVVKVDSQYIYDTNTYGYVYMNVENMSKFALTVGLFYKDDEVAPTISNVTGVSETFTNSDVTITIEGAEDEVAGLDSRPYSFDGGVTWQSSNEKTFAENTENIVIKVRDADGNEYVHDVINITNIDKAAPQISEPVLSTESGKATITINVTEDGSGLNETNEYQYYLSTSKDEQVNGTWTEYVPGEAFEVSEDLSGTYYMFIKSIADNAGNTSEENGPKQFFFDSKAPTITGVTGNPENWTNESVTLTIEGAEDNVELDTEAYSFDGGATWQVTNTKTYDKNTKDIKILVRDAVGKVYTHEVLEISKIDKEVPTVNVSGKITSDGTVTVTINVTENEGELSETNEYQYYVSTSKDDTVGGEWLTYTPNTEFELGTELDGTYYIFVKSVSDKAGNVSEELAAKEFTVVKPDLTAPTITGVTGNPENWTNESVTLTIEGVADEKGLDDEPYSFDNGATWQAANTKTYDKNTKDIKILVRDAAGNKYTHEVLEISKIDKEAPAVNVNKTSTNDGKAKVTISIEDAESGLNAENEYKYNVSTNKDELTNQDWKEYKLGETFEIGENLDNGTYYVTIKNVKDNANNETVVAPIEVTLATKVSSESKPLPYLTFEGITKIISAYINNDFSSLAEDLLIAAGEDKIFSFGEVTGLISLYLSNV